MLKTATLVYKFLHTGFPRYFAPCLSPYSSSYSTRCSQSAGYFLVIPKFYPTVHKSVKQFGNSFAFDVPTVWNALLEEICASPSLASFRNQLKTYPHTKTYPPGIHPLMFSVVLDPSSVSAYCSTVFMVLLHLRVLFVLGRLSNIKIQL